MKTIKKLERIAKHVSLVVSSAASGFLAKAAMVRAVEPIVNATLKDVTKPIQKLSDLVSDIGVVVAGLALAVCFISYMMSGDDPVKRSKAKTGIGIAVVSIAGLAAVPFFVGWMLKT